MYLRSKSPHFSRYGVNIFHIFVLFLFYSTVSASSSLATPDEVWIPGWQSASSMTTARAGAAVISYNNNIYIIGGVDGVNFLNSVESAVVNSDGSLSAWKKMKSMPEQRGFMSAAVFNQRIYVVGGANGSYGKHLLNSIISVPILNNGKLGSWRTESSKMLTPRRCAKLIVDDGKLTVFGGFNGALLDTVETSRFLSNGKLSSWKMQKNQMIMPRYVNEVKKINGYVFAIGGHHPKKGLGIIGVEYSALSRLPLAWKVAPSMKTGRYAFASSTYRQYLYALGGITGTEYLNSIEKVKVGTDGLENEWQPSTQLPASMANFSSVVVKKWIYILGGSTRYGYLQKVSVATFNNTGDIGYYGSQDEFETFNKSANKQQKEITLPNSGKVLESIKTESYTYIRVVTKGKEIWLVAPKIVVSINQKIRFSEGVYMSNFMSKALNRKFAAILFVGTVNKID